MNDWLGVADFHEDIENEIVVMKKVDKLGNLFNVSRGRGGYPEIRKSTVVLLNKNDLLQMVRYNTLYIGCSEMTCQQPGGGQIATAACFYSQP